MRNRLLMYSVLALAGAAHVGQAQLGRGGPPGRGPGGRGGACMQGADSLTDAQKTEVRGLTTAFVAAHAAQLDSLRAIMEAARAAREAGESPDQIRAIMESAKPTVDALAPARKDFSESVIKLLTTSQIAAGCIPPAPGGPPPGGRRGGPPPA